MDFAAKHIGFVLASYAVAAVLLLGLVAALLLRMRNVRRRLAELEAQGAARRRKAAMPKTRDREALTVKHGQEASSS